LALYLDFEGAKNIHVLLKRQSKCQTYYINFEQNFILITMVLILNKKNSPIDVRGQSKLGPLMKKV